MSRSIAFTLITCSMSLLSKCFAQFAIDDNRIDYNDIYFDCSSSALQDLTVSISEEMNFLHVKQELRDFVKSKGFDISNEILFEHNDVVLMKQCNWVINDSFGLYAEGQYLESFNMLYYEELTTNWGGNYRNSLLENHISVDLAPKLLEPTIVMPSPIVVKRILHVGTHFFSYGGHTRVMMSFFQYLKSKEQVLFITNNNKQLIPDLFSGATDIPNLANNIVSCSSESPRGCAAELRILALSFDLIVLHVHTQDVVPVLAFGQGYNGPPVAIINHADDIPWVGSSVIDAHLYLRSASVRLASLRGIEEFRNIKMPLPAGHIMNNLLTKEEYRNELHLPINSVIISVAARPQKFTQSFEYVDIIISVIKQHSNVYFLGVGVDELWSARFQEKQVNTSQYKLYPLIHGESIMKIHIASDIHIDSFPHPGPTSMIESMLSGNVGMSFCPWTNVSDYVMCLEPSDYGYQYEVQSTDNSVHVNSLPKLSPLLTCRTMNAFQTALSDLITNPRKLKLYQQWSREATMLHTGPQWEQVMEDVFTKILDLPRKNIRQQQQLHL